MSDRRPALAVGILGAAAVLLLLLSSCATAPNPKDLPLEMSVSSANYVTSTRKELIKALNARDTLNPTRPAPVPLAQPKTYVFTRGEIYPSDVTFDAVCMQLLGALTKKGYLHYNKLRLEGVAVPPHPELILRVSYGQRTWRMGQIRLDHLEWKEGLVAGHGSGHASGGVVVWDARAGGDDTILHTLDDIVRQQAEAAAGRDGGGSVGASSDFRALASDPTKDHFLVVIDAFEVAELQKKGLKATRAWTTFISLPVRRGQKLSDVVAAMLNVAVPYIGETTAGMQRFDDARVEVIIGETQVIPDTPPSTPEPPQPLPGTSPPPTPPP